ncbi:hypothetical protein [Streptomyces humi]|uniref:hypothetical protein n=1 Tax=Streptomyces humi TaxID=1428620 RepID=UPI001F0AF797|nr:hypothetical protein [Streptomyces humi]
MGNAYLERDKWRRSRHSEQEARSIQSFTDLLQATTDIARTLRQTAEQLEEGRDVDVHEVAEVVDDLIGQVRRQATVVRLVGPRTAFDLVTTLEGQISPIYRLIVEAERSGEATVLVEPARQLMKTRDALIDHLRSTEGLS